MIFCLRLCCRPMLLFFFPDGPLTVTLAEVRRLILFYGAGLSEGARVGEENDPRRSLFPT